MKKYISGPEFFFAVGIIIIVAFIICSTFKADAKQMPPTEKQPKQVKGQVIANLTQYLTGKDLGTCLQGIGQITDDALVERVRECINE